MGTVVEGPTEYHSSRLTRHERKQSLMDEILSDHSVQRYTKKTFLNIQEQKANKKKIHASKKAKGFRRKPLRS